MPTSNGACANYVTVPGFHGFEDAQTGWVARQKLTDASCRESYGWERRKRVKFRLGTEFGRVFFSFVFEDGEVIRVVLVGEANVHVKKNASLAFHRTSDRPEALLCPIVMKSVTKKHPSMWAFISWTAHPKILWKSIKIIKKKGSLRQRANPLPSTPLTFTLSDMCSACHRVSLQLVQWLAKSTWKSEMWQAVKTRKNGYLHLN